MNAFHVYLVWYLMIWFFLKSYHLKTFPQRVKNDQYLCKLNLLKQNGLQITFTWFLVMMYWRTDAYMMLPWQHFCFFKTNKLHVTVGLFNNRSQMTFKCGKNNTVVDEAQLGVSDVLGTFWRNLWSLTEQTYKNHGNYLCYILKKQNAVMVTPCMRLPSNTS